MATPRRDERLAVENNHFRRLTIPNMSSKVKTEDFRASGGMAMKRLMLVLVAAAGLAVAAVPQEERSRYYYMPRLFEGKVSDFEYVPKEAQKNEFTFVRLIYDNLVLRHAKGWYTDYPEGDVHLVEVYRRLVKTDVAPEPRALPILHPDIAKHPFVYSIEGGHMTLSDAEAKRMREYVEHGGFWMIDDFWGSFEWGKFEAEIRKVFPDKEIVDIPPDHQIFRLFDIKEIMQVPNVGWAMRGGKESTWENEEQEGAEIPHAQGIFDDDGRLMVFINWNTDLMDASEWSDHPYYPEYMATYAHKMFLSAHVYAMTH